MCCAGARGASGGNATASKTQNKRAHSANRRCKQSDDARLLRRPTKGAPSVKANAVLCKRPGGVAAPLQTPPQGADAASRTHARTCLHGRRAGRHCCATDGAASNAPQQLPRAGAPRAAHNRLRVVPAATCCRRGRIKDTPCVWRMLAGNPQSSPCLRVLPALGKVRSSHTWQHVTKKVAALHARAWQCKAVGRNRARVVQADSNKYHGRMRRLPIQRRCRWYVVGAPRPRPGQCSSSSSKHQKRCTQRAARMQPKKPGTGAGWRHTHMHARGSRPVERTNRCRCRASAAAAEENPDHAHAPQQLSPTRASAHTPMPLARCVYCRRAAQPSSLILFRHSTHTKQRHHARTPLTLR
jgi:hypothetical protein